MIVVVGIEKGGVGKSTVSSNLAVYRASQGKKVALIDADIQSTITDWYTVRSNSENKNIADFDIYTEKQNIDNVAHGLTEEYDDIIIDVGGKADQVLGQAFFCATKIILPVRPSQADLWSVEKMIDLFPTIEKHNKNLKTIKIIFNQVPTNHFNHEHRLAKNYLKKNAAYVSKCFLYERKLYRDAFVEGFGVIELNNKSSKAKAEIQLLGQEIWGD